MHRDLKPGNLFLTRDVDGRPLVKVLDFGISKTLDNGLGGEGLSLTRTEMLLGSPLYMSPEQMRSSKHVDERSDLWALGAIAYELLTGKVPFEADTILELCFKVAQEKAPSPKTHRPELPDELCLAVLRCLEKGPDLRFQNVGELARAFEPFGLARDRGTAERSLDVLGTGKRPPRTKIETPITAETVLPATPLPALPAAEVSASTEVPSVARVEPVPPAAAWGTTQAQAPPKSRKPLLAIAAGAVAIAAIAGIAASRKTEAPGATGMVAATSGEAEARAKAEADAKAKAEADARTRAKADAGAPVVAVSTGRGRPAVRPAGSASSKPVASSAPPDPGGFIKVRE